MAYINRKKTEEAIRKYADQKHSNGEQIEYVNGILKSISVINEQPTADVEEVKHGEWIEEVVKIPCAWDEGGYETQINYVCSECGFVNDLGKTNGCPECLAKMDGGKANDL